VPTIRRVRALATVVALWLATVVLAGAQAGFEDDRVMLQGFYWESHRHGYPERFPSFGNTRWYQIVREQAAAVREARFDLIWLPPPSFAGDAAAGVFTAGYDPREYFRLDSNYGSFAELRAMLEELLRHGVEPVADVVINHRNGATRWADFRNPDWGVWAICATDEAFVKPESEVVGTPVDQRGRCEEPAPEYRHHGGTTHAYESFRDIAHTDHRVRQDIVRYLRQLRSAGYRGWRYDMAHGYHAKWIALYNRLTTPTFSVGEYDWSSHSEQRGWTWNTATNPTTTGADRLRSASSVFDFTTVFTLEQIRDGRYHALYGLGNGIGMVGDATDGLPWKHRAVTFVQNHDLGYRTNEDGTPQKDHESDRFANNWQVEQAYAHVLTHPGVPTVFWKHYFDWGADLRHKIKALVNARKVAGVHAGSAVYLQENARSRGVYAALVAGRHGDLYVRIGGSDASWEPGRSNYRGAREYAQGAGWKVWVALPGDPPLRQAPLKSALPIPVYRPPDQIDVSDVP
jgi:alpha-amylase